MLKKCAKQRNFQLLVKTALYREYNYSAIIVINWKLTVYYRCVLSDVD